MVQQEQILRAIMSWRKSKRKSPLSILLEGEAGVGKTHFFYQLLEEIKKKENIVVSDKYRIQFNTETDSRQIFSQYSAAKLVDSFNAKASTSGRNALIYSVITQALINSKLGELCVVLIDEVDKANEEVQTFLYGILEEGEISHLDIVAHHGQIVVANPNNLIIVATSNGMKPLQDPLNRRFSIFKMAFPDKQTMKKQILPAMLKKAELYDKMKKQQLNIALNFLYDFRAVSQAHNLSRTMVQNELVEIISLAYGWEGDLNSFSNTFLEMISTNETDQKIIKDNFNIKRLAGQFLKIGK